MSNTKFKILWKLLFFVDSDTYIAKMSHMNWLFFSQHSISMHQKGQFSATEINYIKFIISKRLIRDKFQA